MLLSLLCAVILQCTPTQALAHAIYKKIALWYQIADRAMQKLLVQAKRCS